MTAFSGDEFLAQHDHSANQIQELQRDIKENCRKLQEVQQKRLKIEEETSQCTMEAERRVDLLKEINGVVDLLQQFGEMLQEEKCLNEQLEHPPSADRRKLKDLQEQNDCLTSEVRALSAEIVEMKQRLGEAQYKAEQALISAPTSKSKRNQRKHK